MEIKKFKLTDETIIVDSKPLYRIEALRDFGDVKKGDKGGFVEKEENLSQYGDCWVYGNAMVYGNAKVCTNVLVCGNAKVYDNAILLNDAVICDNAVVCGEAMVCDSAKVCTNAIVNGIAIVYGNAVARGNAEIGGDAKIESAADYIVFKNWWSSGRYFTWTKSNNMWKVGCFYGTGEQLIEKAYKDSVKSGREYEKIVRYSETVN